MTNFTFDEAKEEFFFFLKNCFSQWHHADMVVDGIEYCCCEQYMMAEKAKLFNDQEILEEIMATDSPREQKALGRKVHNFDRDEWEAVESNGQPRCWNIVYKGNYAKFTQNPGLLSELLATQGKTLVEVNPEDCIWGIGLRSKDPSAWNMESWLGTNWLGEVLTILRDDLAEQYLHEVKGYH